MLRAFEAQGPKTSFQRNDKFAYSFGFFFGPGFPLGFGVESVPTPGPLFEPGLGPGMFILFVSSAADGVAPATGVEFVSEALSVDDAEATGGAEVDVDDEDVLDLESLRVEGLDEKRVSKAGGRRNRTILLDFEVLDDLSEDKDEEVAGTEFFDDMMFEQW
ncbi:hypothetical protein MMC16_001475 [Acarospora aff. strigata]|nr:hypothetical protein [Acarospora aff. strigata]